MLLIWTVDSSVGDLEDIRQMVWAREKCQAYGQNGVTQSLSVVLFYIIEMVAMSTWINPLIWTSIALSPSLTLLDAMSK